MTSIVTTVHVHADEDSSVSYACEFQHSFSTGQRVRLYAINDEFVGMWLPATAPKTVVVGAATLVISEPSFEHETKCGAITINGIRYSGTAAC